MLGVEENIQNNIVHLQDQLTQENLHDLTYPQGPHTKRKRELSSYLTFQQKIRVINQHREDPSISQKKLAEWAKQEFNLPTAVTQGTISNILKNSAKILSVSPNELNTKRKRKLLNEQLDIALSAWVRDMEANCIKISGEAIISKARDFSLKMREMDPTATFPDFSAGWLGSFKDRHGIRLSKMSFPLRKKHLVPNYYGEDMQTPGVAEEPNSSDDEEEDMSEIHMLHQQQQQQQQQQHILMIDGSSSRLVGGDFGNGNMSNNCNNNNSNFFKSDESYLAEAAYMSLASPDVNQIPPAGMGMGRGGVPGILLKEGAGMRGGAGVGSGNGGGGGGGGSLSGNGHGNGNVQSISPSGSMHNPSGGNSIGMGMGMGMGIGLSALSGVVGISTSGYTPTDKIIILEQAVNILNEYRLPTKFLRTAQNVIERQRELEIEMSGGRGGGGGGGAGSVVHMMMGSDPSLMLSNISSSTSSSPPSSSSSSSSAASSSSSVPAHAQIEISGMMNGVNMMSGMVGVGGMIGSGSEGDGGTGPPGGGSEGNVSILMGSRGGGGSMGQGQGQDALSMAMGLPMPLLLGVHGDSVVAYNPHSHALNHIPHNHSHSRTNSSNNNNNNNHNIHNNHMNNHNNSHINAGSMHP